MYVIQTQSRMTINSFENKLRQEYETLIAMGCFKWWQPYFQMLNNTKCFNLTTKIDKRENISKI